MNFFSICTLLDCIAAISIYFLFFFPKWNRNLYELFIKSCLYIYGCCVLYVTAIIPVIIPIPFFNMDISQIHINLVPYIDYLNSNGDFIRQILLNILMLVPFGIMYPFIYRKNFKSTIISGLIVSICIELIQLVSARQFSSCDITDVINNGLGVFIGYIIYKIGGKSVKRFLSQLLANKKVKTFSISKRTKTIILAIIIIQLIIRSIVMPLI